MSCHIKLLRCIIHLTRLASLLCFTPAEEQMRWPEIGMKILYEDSSLQILQFEVKTEVKRLAISFI